MRTFVEQWLKNKLVPGWNRELKKVEMLLSVGKGYFTKYKRLARYMKRALEEGLVFYVGYIEENRDFLMLRKHIIVEAGENVENFNT